MTCYATQVLFFIAGELAFFTDIHAYTNFPITLNSITTKVQLEMTLFEKVHALIASLPC